MPNESDRNPTHAGQKRSLLALAATATGVTGLALLRWLRGRRALPVDEAESSERAPQPDLSVEVPPQELPSPAAKKQPALSRWTLARTLIGLACLILAQSLLLGSRNPVIPVILYAIGFVALLSLLNRPHDTTPDRPLRLTDAPVIVGLMVVAGLLYLITPELLDFVNPFRVLLYAFSVLIVFWLGWTVDSPLTGLFAAGFAAVSLWGLVLSKAGGDHTAIAAFGAIFLIELFNAGLARRPAAFIRPVWVGAVALLVFPRLIYLGLLLPLLPGLLLLDDSRRVRRIIARALLIMVAGGVVFLVMFPGFWARQPIPADYSKQVGFSPAVAASDALFSSLLLFDLTSDPDPLHGIVNRPVFDPILAAFFLVGLFGLVWRAYYERRWKDGLLLAALVICLLPVTREILPPLSYPNLQTAGVALPVAVVIAAWGANRIAAQFRALWGSRGQLLAIGLFLLALLVIANDTYRQYTDVSVPAYERAAPVSAEFNTSG